MCLSIVVAHMDMYTRALLHGHVHGVAAAAQAVDELEVRGLGVVDQAVADAEVDGDERRVP